MELRKRRPGRLVSGVAVILICAYPQEIDSQGAAGAGVVPHGTVELSPLLLTNVSSEQIRDKVAHLQVKSSEALSSTHSTQSKRGGWRRFSIPGGSPFDPKGWSEIQNKMGAFLENTGARSLMLGVPEGMNTKPTQKEEARDDEKKQKKIKRMSIPKVGCVTQSAGARCSKQPNHLFILLIFGGVGVILLLVGYLQFKNWKRSSKATLSCSSSDSDSSNCGSAPYSKRPPQPQWHGAPQYQVQPQWQGQPQYQVQPQWQGQPQYQVQSQWGGPPQY